MNDALPSGVLSYFGLVLLPFTLAAAGWLVAKLVQYMALKPRHFIGIPPYLGWQGYFEANRENYSRIWSAELLEKLVGLQLVFENISPEKLVTHQISYIRPQLDAIIDDVMSKNNLVLWENLPVLVKNRLYARAHSQLPRIIDDIIEEFGEGLTRIVAHKDLLVQAESRMPGTMQRIYHVLSNQAFKSITRFSAVVGFMAGLLQMAVYWFLPSSNLWFWLLSASFTIFCLFWLSQFWLKLPLERYSPKFCRLRNPFQRHQQTKNEALAQILAETVYSVDNLTSTLFASRRSYHLQRRIRRRVSSIIEDVDIRTLIQVTLGPVGYVKLKNLLTAKLSSVILEPFKDKRFNDERSIKVAVLLRKRLEKLAEPIHYGQLEHIMKPLAVIGGIGGLYIGGLTGVLQWLISMAIS